MSNLIPFTDAALPANIAGRKRLIDVNKDIVTSAPFPSLSIKGKVFTLVQDSERRILTKPDDPEETIQAVNMAFLRINMDSKNYYSKRYTEEDSEGQRPDCYSNDGKVPSPQSPEPQAVKCAVCPHNMWGAKVREDGTAGKGKACSDHARIAIADPKHLKKPMLLRVPPASLKPLKDALKMVKTRQLQYNEVVFRVGFDREAPSPKLTFKAVGVLADDGYAEACEMFDSDIVHSIVGMDESDGAAATPVAHEDDGGELDAALAARSAKPKVEEPAAPPAPAKPAVKAPAKPAVKAVKPAEPPKAAPTPAALPAGDDDLLGDLDGILGASDD